jgi:hypothetical protein
MMDRLKTAALAVALAALASPAFAGWRNVKDEPDPFGPKGTATFVAGESNGSISLWIRCLEGKISLELVVEAFGVSDGDRANVKLVADSKDIREDNYAQVVEASTDFTGIQFGDEDTLDYLEGAQKLSVRAEVRGSYETVSFAGGKSMDGVIDKALKACGKFSPSEDEPTPTEPPASPRGKDCSGIPMEKRTLDCAPS